MVGGSVGGAWLRLRRRQGEAQLPQLLQQLLIGGGSQPLLQRLHDLAADAMHRGDRFRRFPGGGGQGLGAGEGPGQGLGAHLAHVMYAQAVELAMPGLLPGSGQRLQQILGRPRAHALQAGQQRPVEAIDIGDGGHQPPIHQLLDQLATQPLHVQGPLAHPVAQGAPQDRRAAAVHAAGGCLAYLPHQLRAALGAHMRQLQPRGTRRPQIGQHPHHLGDDLARLAHHDRVAGMQVEFSQPVGVVQGGAAHAGAGQGHRFKLSHGGHDSGATHLTGQP